MFTNNFMIPIFYGDIGETTKKKLAKRENSRTFAIIISQLINMALDYRYNFTGLPDTIDERVLKQSLLFYGNTVFFDLGGVPIALPSAPNGEAIDIYGNCKSANVFARNGKINYSIPLNYKYTESIIDDVELTMGADTKKVKNISPTTGIYRGDITNGVIIWENKTRQPFIWTVIYYAERIADSLRTLDSVRRWLKMPFIPRVEESEGKSFDESLKAFMNNEDFTVSLKARTLDKTDIFSVDIPSENVTKITQLVEWYYSQFKLLCGINANSQVDKKGENLISDEVNIDETFTDLNADSIIEYINTQLEVFNKLSGESIRAGEPRSKEKREGAENEGEEKDLNGVDRDGGRDISE